MSPSPLEDDGGVNSSGREESDHGAMLCGRRSTEDVYLRSVDVHGFRRIFDVVLNGINLNVLRHRCCLRLVDSG